MTTTTAIHTDSRLSYSTVKHNPPHILDSVTFPLSDAANDPCYMWMCTPYKHLYRTKTRPY